MESEKNRKYVASSGTARIGEYKLISGSRIRLNKRSQEILGLKEKGDEFKVYYVKNDGIHKGSIFLTHCEHELGGVFQPFGKRKMYDDGTACWANIPKKIRDILQIGLGDSLDMYEYSSEAGPYVFRAIRLMVKDQGEL